MRNREGMSDRLYLLLALLLLAAACFNLFMNLGVKPIEDWDEARHGVSAYEMLKSGNYAVNTYNGETDYWNLKPPLSFWAVALGYKLAGFNLLGLRLVSAIAALLTIAATAGYARYRYGNAASLVAAAVLITSTQFIFHHSARAGDADALFVLWLTVGMIALLMTERRPGWIALTGLMFALAFLTKSWHAGILLVIAGLYTVFTRRYREMKPRHLAGFGLAASLPVLLWLALRYPHDGFRFVREMIRYDLLARSSTAIEQHANGPTYYLHILKLYHLEWSAALLALAVGTAFVMLLRRNRDILPLDSDMLGLILWIAVPLLLFSAVSTKIRWYIMPVYPALALATAVLLAALLRNVRRREGRAALAGAFVLLFLLMESGAVRTASSPDAPDAGPEQALLRKLPAGDSLREYTLYYYDHPGEDMPQSVVLASKLYGGMRAAEEGKLQEFRNHPRSLLLLPRSPANESLIADDKLKIVEASDWGYLVSSEYVKPAP
ncbi:ArnT family glycosyltransferase [Paenibacillus glufosinatiresistens]|uniref:ArnT family glycosyltransferase n=1 Tax=Paenibacillus glufosinatiresistens TaxID=3070657 RepID=UPI00286DE68C|nr:glycosyltransferase family 39 protein [Paenibacillus sp. YX.27]